MVSRFSFNDCNGLKYLIQSCLDMLLESRANLLKVISQFAAAPTRVRGQYTNRTDDYTIFR